MALSDLIVRVPVMDGGAGKVGYMLAVGKPDGSWRITEKEYGVHDLVAMCDTPEAFFPALRDYYEKWYAEQKAQSDLNVAIVKSWPDRRPGWRPGWKAKELAVEARQLDRTRRLHVRLLHGAASRFVAAGWLSCVPDDLPPMLDGETVLEVPDVPTNPR